MLDLHTLLEQLRRGQLEPNACCITTTPIS
jgi:hypothetical protein